MGQRQKFIYRDGELRDAFTQQLIRRWRTATVSVIPPAYTVAMRTAEGTFVYIVEDEEGIHIDSNAGREILSSEHITLPTFLGHQFPLVSKILYNEIMVNFNNGVPFNNILAHDPLREEDYPLIVAILLKTGHLELLTHSLRAIGYSESQVSAFLPGESQASDETSGVSANNSYPLTWSTGSEKAQYKKLWKFNKEYRGSELILPSARKAASVLFHLLSTGVEGPVVYSPPG
jgi:hypothetical protein